MQVLSKAVEQLSLASRDESSLVEVKNLLEQLLLSPVKELGTYPWNYGVFLKTSDTSPAVINTAYEIEFDSASYSKGVEIDGTNPERINILNSGIYKLQMTFQLTSDNLAAKNIWFWVAVNGTNEVNSAQSVSFDDATTANEKKTISHTWVVNVDRGQYLSIKWAADNTNVTLDFTASTAFAPAVSSAILKIEEIRR